MENRRAFIIALICLLVAMVLVSAYVRVRRAEMTAEFGDEVDVVVSAGTIAEYALITPQMLKVVRVFKKFKQPGTYEEIDDIVGKSTYVMIYAGEQITATKLVTQDGKPVLDRQVEKKMRAITLQVAPHTAVSRLIRPGNRIDILTAVNYDQDGNTIFEIKTLVQNALVLAAGKNVQNSVPTRVNREVLGYLEEQFEQRRRKDFGTANTEALPTTRPHDDYGTVTLQLTTEDAEKVAFITHTFGDQRLYFTLRNSADIEVAKLDTALMDDVLGPESDYGFSKRKPPALPPPPPPRFFDSRGGVSVPVE